VRRPNPGRGDVPAPTPIRDPALTAGEAVPQPASDPAALLVEAPLRVAFQGELGGFSEEAILQLWGPAADPVPVRTFEDVADAAETGHVDFGLLPIESTLVGGVDSAYDLLALHDRLHIVAEVIVPVRLALLALPNTRIGDLRTLSSHPLLLAQCQYFLDRHRYIRTEPAWDSAGAAREVAERGDPLRAAAGPRRAAERFGLSVLAEGIEDRPDSQLRFVAVSLEPASPPADVPARTAALCVFRHSAGGLLTALRPIADAGLNISHLASRPTREPWRYQFFLEIEHPALDADAVHALAEMRRSCLECRVLGTYPRWVTGFDDDATGMP
jgi:prephenate dehydratase